MNKYEYSSKKTDNKIGGEGVSNNSDPLSLYQLAYVKNFGNGGFE